MIEVLYALGMFGLIFTNDFAWTWWSKSCAAEHHFQAATASVTIYLLGGLSVIGYVGRPWLLIPACMGAFAGTICASRWIKKGINSPL